MKQKYVIKKIARSSEDGRFVTMEEAKKHPKTTEVETVKIPVKTEK